MARLILGPLYQLFREIQLRLRESSVWLSEIGCGFSLILLGVLITILPEPSDNDPTTSWPSLALLRAFFGHSDILMVTVIIIIGLGQSGFFKRIDDSWHYPVLRWLASIFCGWVYSMIVISLVSSAMTPLIAPFIAIIIMNAGLAIRILIIGVQPLPRLFK